MNFKPLVPKDYQIYKPFFIKQSYHLCAYSLSSLMVWHNTVYHPHGAIQDDRLIIYAKYDEPRKKEEHMILPVSPDNECSPEELYDIAREIEVPEIWFVPEDYIQRYGKSRIGLLFRIDEHARLHDYVYRTEDIASLKGNKYSRKRNLIHQFKKEYADKGRVIIEEITPQETSECLYFLEKWCEEFACGIKEDEDFTCEKQAVTNTLTHFQYLSMKGLLLRIDGVVSAFGISSHLTGNMAVLQFEKAFTHIKGLYQYIDQLCAQQLFAGYEFINKESDMNLPGLAKAKRSYHPVMMIKSYGLTIR